MGLNLDLSDPIGFLIEKHHPVRSGLTSGNMSSGRMNLNVKENRKVTGELDFFSAGKLNDHSNFPVIDRSSNVVEHENSDGEANPDVNVS